MTPPKGKLGTARLAARGDGQSIVLADGKPPAEFRIFRAGVNDSDYGPITFDSIAAAMVMQSAAEKGNPFFFDFNHGMTVDGATDEQGKSAGQFSLEVRDGELWAVNCKYTENGAARLASREYNLFSPYFGTVTDADGICRPYQLKNVAFVNLAGLNDLTPIAAGARRDNEGATKMKSVKCAGCADPMKGLKIDDGDGDEDATDAYCAACYKAGAKKMSAAVVALGMRPDAGDADQVAAVTGLLALRGQVRKFTGQDTDEKAVAALSAIVSKAERTDAAEAEVAEIKATAARAEFDAVLDGAAKDGRLPPADRKKLEETILALTGGKITSQAIEAAKTNVSMLSARVTTRPTPEPTGQGATLPEGLRVNLAGLKPESITKAYERQQARRAARGTL